MKCNPLRGTKPKPGHNEIRHRLDQAQSRLTCAREKPKRIKQLPNRIFDIHNHILWGVDDGSDSLAMSLRMLEQAQEAGTTDIILTPHNKPNRRNIYKSEMLEQIEELKKHMANKNIHINIYPGNEIYYRMDVAERLSIGKASTMAGSRYVLLEYNPMDEWDYIRHGAEDMLSEGYIPIIAHVERYNQVMTKLERAQELKDKGCYLQINASSLTGELGWGTKSLCKQLLKQNLVSFVASDAHDDKKRVPDLDKAVKYIVKKYGEETAEKIFSTNPQKILADTYL